MLVLDPPECPLLYQGAGNSPVAVTSSARVLGDYGAGPQPTVMHVNKASHVRRKQNSLSEVTRFGGRPLLQHNLILCWLEQCFIQHSPGEGKYEL